jgi:hypothetical protein
MLANRVVARWSDALAFNPTPKVVAVKDAVAIADNVFGCRVREMDRPAQERANATLGGNIPENLIQLERRHSAGRRLRRTDYRPFPIQADRRRSVESEFSSRDEFLDSTR